MSDIDSELIISMNETIMRLIGVIERLQDENRELRARAGVVVTSPTVTVPGVTWPKPIVTCNTEDGR